VIDADEKLARIRNESTVDHGMLLNLWLFTLHVRRTAIRNRTTQEIMVQYPEYSKPLLVREIELAGFCQ
jgi:hypothetical protein